MNVLQPEEAMDIVSSGNPAFISLPNGHSVNDIGGILFTSMASLLPLINLIAVLIIIVSGMVLIGSQDDSQISVARTVLIASCIGLVLINIAVPLRNALLLSFDEGGDVATGVAIISVEVLGVINFFESIIAILAILMLIVSGVRAIASFGSEQENTNIRRTVISVVTAIMLLIAKFGLVQSFAVTGKPSAFIGTLVDATFVVVGFMALVALTMIVIAGIIMVANHGDQQAANRAKGLIIKTVIGLVIIVLSTAVLDFLVFL